VEVAVQEEAVQGKQRRMEKPEMATEMAVEEEVLLLFQVLMLAEAPVL
jgi:hypothetical protein